jgi:hypothetical protein
MSGGNLVRIIVDLGTLNAKLPRNLRGARDGLHATLLQLETSSLWQYGKTLLIISHLARARDFFCSQLCKHFNITSNLSEIQLMCFRLAHCGMVWMVRFENFHVCSYRPVHHVDRKRHRDTDLATVVLVMRVDLLCRTHSRTRIIAAPEELS